MLDRTCEQFLDQKFLKYERVTMEFSKFFGQDELSLQLSTKADMQAIDLINRNKAGKDELANTEGLLENLNDRVKHLASVTHKLATSLLPVKNQIASYDEHSHQ